MLNLDFDGHNTLYATHGLHAFAAKCPPQLAHFAVERYSKGGDKVLDPMVGSGTTLVESRLLGRNAIGYDIDPLSVLIARVKSRPLSDDDIENAYTLVRDRYLEDFKLWLRDDVLLAQGRPIAVPDFHNRDYWFNKDVAAALTLLAHHISVAELENELRDFLWVAFSSIILSRTSVANARDITHSRHHHYVHAKPPNVTAKFEQRIQLMRRHMEEFWRLHRDVPDTIIQAEVGDARSLPLNAAEIDLIFTSPPYATALDYPRAHYLAIPWMKAVVGLDFEDYMKQAPEYIGSERGTLPGNLELDPRLTPFPTAEEIIMELSSRSVRHAKLIQRYFLDMHQAIKEMWRVLSNGGHCILVVCPSHIRKVEIPTHAVLCNIAQDIGFRLARKHVRTIDERRRLLPYMKKEFGNRMSTEYVLVLEKP